MQANTVLDGDGDVIYVIFRVYNLGRDDMGVRIYLDPEALRLSGQLRFVAENWLVTPTDGW